jgi:imidazolonepropionase-like amidohydrolase
MKIYHRWIPALAGLLVLGLAVGSGQSDSGVKAFTGARLIDGNGKAVGNATIVVRDGKVVAAGPKAKVPKGAQTISLAGKTVVPGFVNAHGHMNDQYSGGGGGGAKKSSKSDDGGEASLLRQLGVYSRYGITTVWSLGGEPDAAVKVRDSQDTPTLDRARLYYAGQVIVGKTPDEARQMIAKVAQMKPDIIKIRVDDNLGANPKMTPDVYAAVIEEAHKRGFRVAVHIFYLDDAKALLRLGADYIAHSVRDKDVDAEFISMMKQRDIPYCPTFTREFSTYGYDATPAFFKDPFFLREANKEVMARLEEPAAQAAMKASKSAQGYKAAMPVANRNLKKLSDAGVRIVMGTDTGAAPGRFQGYFEHMEMHMMAEAGMTPAQVLRASTSNGAHVLKLDGKVGTLEPGAWADFVVLDKDPLQDIHNTESVASVWIAGNQLKR